MFSLLHLFAFFLSTDSSVSFCCLYAFPFSSTFPSFVAFSRLSSSLQKLPAAVPFLNAVEEAKLRSRVHHYIFFIPLFSFFFSSSRFKLTSEFLFLSAFNYFYSLATLLLFCFYFLYLLPSFLPSFHLWVSFGFCAGFEALSLYFFPLFSFLFYLLFLFVATLSPLFFAPSFFYFCVEVPH